jgi:flagellar basal body-associated protein FliL
VQAEPMLELTTQTAAKSKNIALFILAGLLICCSGVLVFFYIRKNKAKPSNT